VKRAAVTESGLWRRFFGYARSSPLSLVVGTDEACSDAPRSACTTISFQPIRPA